MDSEALKEISFILELQNDWIKRKALGLFIDPFIIESKIKIMKKEELASIFLSSWHPIAYIEQITIKKLINALDYWKVLTPLSQRLKELESAKELKERIMKVSELINLRIISDRKFNEEINKMKEEIKNLKKPIDYWDFIMRDSYEETIFRAYLLSFIISEGFVKLIINPLEEKILIELCDNKEIKKESKSFPIVINYEIWKEKRDGK
ncbi:MAG: hypothetical protein NO475_03945 [Candidatus Methanomethylicia archaeon]|jgi:hypothetical protein|uniref:Uncharacterized protein n=1 Tax=Thermoproteota archaeon TaxID=2056631 RepID=A0A520KFC0_9CREN|nr:hypothetical protein [Candidatus Methanomethylicia archaeon]MCQ5340942.1 hypothetical protein [Candidatus Methanomethylicia archaeon]RZN55993.1 MAG: hypothetical protein EF809_03925 [Candidatus Verstraetearchaeota archaeon]TDA40535.1 MAG: hypothetical protein DSO09_00235 [Candidatus Verstraetearchaeota archaeon]